MDLKETILQEVAKVMIEHEEKDFVGATVTLHVSEDFRVIITKVSVGICNIPPMHRSVPLPCALRVWGICNIPPMHFEFQPQITQ